MDFSLLFNRLATISGTLILSVLIISMELPERVGKIPSSNPVPTILGGLTNQMNIRPLYDRIVVKRIEGEDTVKIGGLYIPDTAKEKPQEGEVFAVGQGKRLEDGKVTPLDVKAGDRILFGKYSGSEIKLDGQEYLIMREDEVLGVLVS